ncbi:MAG: undecaprenyl-diphosphate phosphatase [Pirellulaceae bacterium]|nr:undecaprenyl-diphosphate phosphatase [Pirellulaceae bacterium]
MNEYMQAIVIGIVEGLTEFLPVSSTAHIRITQGLLGQDAESDYWKMFAVVIQLGAILSVVIFFWKRLWSFAISYPKGESGQGQWWSHPLALVGLSFVVTALPCFLIDKQIGEFLENYYVIGSALIVGGILMWLIDGLFSSRATTTSMEPMSLKQAIVIGLAQILAAAFPGTSRSMATIAGGQVMGLSRSAALEFSFFLSIPVMFAATGYKLLKYLLDAPTGMSATNWGVLGVGFMVSFVVALLVIAWFMRWVRTRGFVPFAIYRIIAGIALIIWAAQ